jgi:putative cell wall-binding protein
VNQTSVKTISARLKRLLPIALVLGLLGGGLGATLDALPAAAAPVSSVSFAGSSMGAGATATTWTVRFTTSAGGALHPGDEITVTFNPAFVIGASPTVDLTGGFTGSPLPLVPSGDVMVAANVVTITLFNAEELATLTTGTLTINEITNPTSASYPAASFSVATTLDTAASPASPVVITGLTGVSFAGSSMMAGATATTWTIQFTTSADGALSPGREIVVTFNPAFVIGANPTVDLTGGFTGSPLPLVPSGDVVVAANVVTITLFSAEVLAANTTGTLTINEITNPAATTYAAASFSVATTVDTAGSPAAGVVITGMTPLPTQIFGTDAIGTSIAISQAEFPTAGSAGAVVLVRDDFFSDGLAGGPLAAAVNGPLLLTEGDPISPNLDPRTEAEIQRVLPTGRTVYILGGDLALSPTIDTTLTGLGYMVVREAGSDEFATAVDIAQQLGNPSVVFEATGLSFYDALSAVPAAIKSGAAILLTNGATQAPETATYLAAHPGDARFAIGGPLAAFGADPTATPVYGADLYNTSAAVATQFFPGATIYGAATAADFPDALGGGVYMATGGRSGPLLLVNQNTPLPSEILPYLATLAQGTIGFVFGGPLAVGASVLSALQAAVG